jgi:hypothetical protein
VLPLALRACRLDLAAASTQATPTLVDVSDLIIYFSLQKIFILAAPGRSCRLPDNVGIEEFGRKHTHGLTRSNCSGKSNMKNAGG